MKFIRTAAALILAGWGTLMHLQAQISGPQNPSSKNFTWMHLSTDRFDVHFYAKDPVIASSAARYAEEALFNLSKTLDFKPRLRYHLFLFQSPYDYMQSNMYEEEMLKEGGFTPLKHNSACVVYKGNAGDLHKDIQTQVARILMDEFYFGGGVQTAVQNSVLLYEPRWFKEGFPAWLGEGWTVEDEMWIASLGTSGLLDFAIDGDQPIHHTVRKSVWYYIVQNYGPEKLSEIFYMTRLYRSADAGVIHVLGITLKTLTERWREFILQRVSENEEGRELLKDKATRIELPKGERVLSSSLNPTSAVVAMCLEKNGIERIVLYDLENKTFTETGISGGYKSKQLKTLEVSHPMAWSSDGKKLAAVFFDGREEKIAWLEPEKKAKKITAVRPNLECIYEMAWSHDNSMVAVSGLRTGSVDIFVMNPGGTLVSQITDDLYDDHHPAWSLDDQQIFYASNRPQPQDSITEYPYQSWKYTTDIFRSSYPSDKSGAVQVTSTPVFNEFPLYAPSSFELVFLTDEPGILNLKKKNIFLGDSTFITNISQGMDHASFNDSLVVFTSPWRGNEAVWYSPASEFYTEGVVLNSRLRHYLYLEYQKEHKALNDLKRKSIDTLAKNNAPDPKNVIVPEPAKTDTVVKRKYYVFDEEDSNSSESERKRKIQRNQENTKPKKDPPRPEFGLLVPKGPLKTKPIWTADHVTARLGWDPVFKLNILFESGFKDLQGNHRLSVGYRPYVDLKSSDFIANYSYLKNRLDYHAGIEHQARFINRSDFAYRYMSTGARIGVSYPLDRFNAVSGGLRYSYLHRIDLDPFEPNSLDGTGHLMSASINFQHDTREYSESFVKKGAFITAGVRNAFSFSTFSNNFVSFTADARKYIPVGNKIVLATRVTGGISAGSVPQQFFIGGTEDWLFSRFGAAPDFPINQDISAFHYMEYVTPMRGFMFNARNGTKYFVANAELRIPLSRAVLSALNSNSPYNVEFIPFCDFGTAWNTGNPLSQKNPISTNIIDQYPLYIEVQTLRSPFVMGFGSGLRIQVFGYSTRVDLAWGIEDYSLQKPKVHLSLGKNF